MGRNKKRNFSVVKDLEPAFYNPRKITSERLQMLKESMGKFGDLSGVVVNRSTGNIIGGHQRVKNFDANWPVDKIESKDELGTVAIGYIETPFGKWNYREVEWDEQTEKAANIAANNHGGDFDEIMLAELVRNLDSDLRSFIGFDSEGLEKLLGEFDNIEELTTPPIVGVNENFAQMTFTFTVSQKEEVEFMLNDIGESEIGSMTEENPNRNTNALLYLLRNK